MNTPSTVVNIAGKSYLINQNFEKGALLNIINKLQTDLSQIKNLAQDQRGSIISDTQIACINSDITRSLASGTSSFHSPANVELKTRLKKNYEEKVQNLINLYEKKLDEYKEKVKYLEDDREAFVEALEAKHSTIKMKKTELVELETKKNQEIEELKNSHELEITKVKNDLAITQTCYKDLEQVRKLLEKNNQLMKTEVVETQTSCEKKLTKIAEDYEQEKQKYKNDLKQIKSAIELIERQAEAKIGELEETMQTSVKDHESEIEHLKQEINMLRQQVKQAEESKQKLELEQKSYEDKIEHSSIYYETKINNISLVAKKDHEQYVEEVSAVKEKFEKQFTKLEEEYVILERDVKMKQKEFLECEALKKQLANEVADLRTELDLANRKHTEEYDLLKQNFENTKKSYETEHANLKATLLDKEKIADDLDIANKKYEKQYNCLKMTIKTMKEEAEEDSTKMWEKLKSEKLFYQDEIDKLKAEYSSRIKKQDEEVVRIKKENYELTEQIDKLESTKRSLEKANRELRLGLDCAFEEYKDDIERINREMDSKSTDYETKIEEIQSELIKHQKTIIQYEELNKMLQETNEEYKLINADNMSKYSTDIGRLRDELAMTKRFHEDDISSIQKQLELKEQIEKEKDDRIQKLKQQITDIKMSQTTNVDEKIDKLEKIRKELETENTVLKHRVSDLSEDFKIQKDNYDTTNERLKKRYEDEKQKLKEQNEELLETLENLEKTVSDQERENKLLRKNLEDISKRQSDDTVELAENLSHTRQKYDEKVSKLKQELEVSRRNYEEDLEKARTEFHADRQQYEEKIQELKIECNSRKLLYQELEMAKKELEENWTLLQKDEFKKLAFLGAMGKLKFMKK